MRCESKQQILILPFWCVAQNSQFQTLALIDSPKDIRQFTDEEGSL